MCLWKSFVFLTLYVVFFSRLGAWICLLLFVTDLTSLVIAGITTTPLGIWIWNLWSLFL